MLSSSSAQLHPLDNAAVRDVPPDPLSPCLASSITPVRWASAPVSTSRADMTNRQYRRRKVTAQSTWKKSVASIVDAWLCRNARQLVALGNTISRVLWASGSDVVLLGEFAEDLLAADPELGEVDRFRRVGAGLSWCELAEGAVRPSVVVVRQVFRQHPSQVVLVDDQQLVEELPVQGTDECGVEGQAGQDSRGEQAIDQRHASLGLEHRAAEPGAGAGLTPASTNITAAVTPVQPIPSDEWRG